MANLKKKSFTLLELIVVIVILGVLAVLGLPNYFAATENAKNKEAVANLKLIRAAEKIYRMEIGAYMNCPNTANLNTNMKLSIPAGTSPNWNYKVDTATTTTFIGKAQRASGPNQGNVWCINESTEEPYWASCTW